MPTEIEAIKHILATMEENPEQLNPTMTLQIFRHLIWYMETVDKLIEEINTHARNYHQEP